MSRIQHWTTPNVEPNIEIRDYFAVSGADESMHPLGVYYTGAGCTKLG